MEKELSPPDGSSERQASDKIASGMRRAISSGEIDLGSSLPSLRLMAQETNCAVNTVRAAYETLVADGFIVKPLGLTSRYRVTSDPFVSTRFSLLRSSSHDFIKRMRLKGFSNAEIFSAIKEESR